LLYFVTRKLSVSLYVFVRRFIRRLLHFMWNEANNWILRSAVKDLQVKQLLPVK
jgi:hypothetical protein